MKKDLKSFLDSIPGLIEKYEIWEEDKNIIEIWIYFKVDIKFGYDYISINHGIIYELQEFIKEIIEKEMEIIEECEIEIHADPWEPEISGLENYRWELAIKNNKTSKKILLSD